MRFGRSCFLTLCVIGLLAGCDSSASTGKEASGTGGNTGRSGGGTGGTRVGSGGTRVGSEGGSLSHVDDASGGDDGSTDAGGARSTTNSGGIDSGGIDSGGIASAGAKTGGSAGTSAGGAASIDPSAELYDPDTLPRFEIELPQASVDALALVTGPGDPRQDTYVTGNLRYGTETITNIGLRIKGESSFQNLDRKPALKLKFDEFVPKQEFRGLRRLTLNNLFEDPSFIAERLAYDVYRAAGVPAPRCNSALVYINGTFYGVYANVEAEDKTFLRRWFTKDGGNLYEASRSDFVPGAETVFNLETNETADDRTDMKNLIAAVQGASDPQTFLDDIGGMIDTARFLEFTAAEAAVNQWDMYAYTRFFVNNFRIYDDPESGRFHFIPWGHDLSMKPFRDSGKPFVGLFELARQSDSVNGKVVAGLLFQRCLKSPGCVSAYREAVSEVIQVYESLNLEAAATRYYDQIRSAVYADARKNICCGPVAPLTNQGFETAYQSVLSTIRGRTAALRTDLGE